MYTDEERRTHIRDTQNGMGPFAKTLIFAFLFVFLIGSIWSAFRGREQETEKQTLDDSGSKTEGMQQRIKELETKLSWTQNELLQVQELNEDLDLRLRLSRTEQSDLESKCHKWKQELVNCTNGFGFKTCDLEEEELISVFHDEIHGKGETIEIGNSRALEADYAKSLIAMHNTFLRFQTLPKKLMLEIQKTHMDTGELLDPLYKWDRWETEVLYSSCDYESIYNSDEKRNAIVMSFSAAEREEVIKNVRSWNKYPPCSSSQGSYSKKTDLVFYYTNKNRKHEMETMLSEFQSHPGTAKIFDDCFANVVLVSGNLTDQTDKFDENHCSHCVMFTQMFGSEAFVPYKFVFYMEPDVYPIRSNWNKKIWEETLEMKGLFWSKGSVSRVAELNDAHSNLNSIFRLGDQCFQMFIQRCFSKWHNQKVRFDAALRECLPENKDVHSKLLEKMEYSDILISEENFWPPHIDQIHPNTYFAHGEPLREAPNETAEVTFSEEFLNPDIVLSEAQADATYLGCDTPREPFIVAYLVPFTFEDIDRVIANIEEWTIGNYDPCTKDNESVAFVEYFQERTRLYFQYLRDPDMNNEMENKKLADFRQILHMARPSLERCFQNASEIHSFKEKMHNETEACHFIRSVTSDPSLVAEVTHVFIMSPYVQPLRARWAESVFNAAKQDQSVWMKGAVDNRAYFKHNATMPIMSPNAIYAVGNECFNHYLERVDRLYPKMKCSEALFQFREERIVESTRIWHQFDFLDFYKAVQAEFFYEEQLMLFFPQTSLVTLY